MADTFASRFARVESGPGPLVWGLDPSGALLEAWGLGDNPVAWIVSLTSCSTPRSGRWGW